MLTDQDIKKLSEVLATKEDIRDLQEQIDTLKESVQALTVAVDGLTKAIKDLTAEYAATASSASAPGPVWALRTTAFPGRCSSAASAVFGLGEA